MSASSDRTARLLALLEQALDLDPARRDGWLDAACAGDQELRDELAALLMAHDRSGGVLDRRLPVPEPEPVADRLREALADRYELRAELGRGGMATVFLAQERKHDRRVVVKVLHPEVAAAFGPERFLAEVRIAARLSHPHILGLIDSGEAAGLLYYVMPHVPGMTLRERIRQNGPLDAGAAITLLRDIAAALEHAHGAGIVHRDLKPENVLCVGDHAFLMDFGVAQLEAEARGPGRPTDPGFPVGTPGYMSPEQASGRVVDHRTDLYAWGLVAREMLAGPGGPQADLAAGRPDLPAGFVRLVERCLQREPADRVQRAAELVRELDAMVGPVQTLPPARTGGRRVSRWLVLATVVLVALVVLVSPRSGNGGDPGVPMPVAVAVLRNETGDSTLAMLGRFAGDWITQGLHETGLFRVVPWLSVLHAADRWEVTRTSGAPPELLGFLGDETGARTIVSGRYYLVGDRLRLQVEITDARRGDLLGAPTPVEVPLDSAAAGIQLLRDRVMGALAVRASARFGALPGLSDRPPTFEAYRLFDRGLTRYNAQEYRAAVADLLDAARLDTTFVTPLVYAALGAGNTGQYGLMDSLLAVLDRRRGELHEYEELHRQYLAALQLGDGPRALVAIRAAAAVGAGTRAGYNAALTALTLNRPAEALADLEALDPDRGLLAGWSSYWTQLAHALHLLGRHDDELRAVRDARTRYPDRRVNLVLEIRALVALGREAEADSLWRAHEGLPTETYWSQGAMLVNAGEELVAHGAPGRGYEWLRRGVAWLAPRAELPGAPAGHRFWLATAWYHLGDDSAAVGLFSALAAQDPGEASNRGFHAAALARLGRWAEAERVLERAAPRQAGDYALARARLAAIRGDHAEAISLLDRALAHGVNGWSWVHASTWRDFAPLSDSSRFVAVMDRRPR